MSRICSAPVPIAKIKITRTLHCPAAPSGGSGTNAPATLPATGQQWPLPLL